MSNSQNAIPNLFEGTYDNSRRACPEIPFNIPELAVEKGVFNLRPIANPIPPRISKLIGRVWRPTTQGYLIGGQTWREADPEARPIDHPDKVPDSYIVKLERYGGRDTRHFRSALYSTRKAVTFFAARLDGESTPVDNFGYGNESLHEKIRDACVSSIGGCGLAYIRSGEHHTFPKGLYQDDPRPVTDPRLLWEVVNIVNYYPNGFGIAAG